MLACPHCHTLVPETAGVCTGCGAEVVRGLSRRGRSFVGLLFVGLAVFIGAIVLRALEIAHIALPRQRRNTGHLLLLRLSQ